MTSEKLYFGKLCNQMISFALLKNNLTDINTLTDSECLDIYLSCQQFIDQLERLDIETFKSMLPNDLLIKEKTLTISSVKDILDIIIISSKDYSEYVTNYLNKQIEKLNEEYQKRGFSGIYPKYYKELENEVLFAQYDEDLFLEKDEILANRMAVLIKVKDFKNEFPLLSYDTFSYNKLFINYEEKLASQSGKIRFFIIHLPNRNYLIPLTELNILEEIKYLDVVDAVVNKQKLLPKWYDNIRKSVKDIRKMYIVTTIFPLLMILSILNYLLFKGNFVSLLIICIVGYIIDYNFANFLAKKKYDKYHNIY